MGSGGDRQKYANNYLDERLWQLEKDVSICMASVRPESGKGHEHAYFPALMTCCGMLELFANLYAGESQSQENDARYERIYAYKNFLPSGHGYTKENLGTLYGSLRNAIAHHATAAGVWIDSITRFRGRRITWKLTASPHRPGLRLANDRNYLVNDPFDPCLHTHRLQVNLDRFWRDVRDSVESTKGFRRKLNDDPQLVRNFHQCIDQIFPRTAKK